MTLSISARRKKAKLLARYEAQARRDAEKRRNILIENLKEQRLLAEAFVQPPCYVPMIWRFSKIVSGTGGRMRRA